MAEEKVSAYLFAVEIDGIESARFQKCSGFEAETGVFEIEEGGFGVHKFKGRTKWPNIVLERGVNENNSIYQWYKQTVEGKIERKTGAIVLYDLAGNEIKRWNFYNALPCKWIGPKLNARDPCTFAVERIEIAHEGIVCEDNGVSCSKQPKEEKESVGNEIEDDKSICKAAREVCSYSVDPVMFSDDESAGVLRNGSYIKNPTAKNINEYISEGSNYLGSKNMNGDYMYVIDMDGNIIIGNRAGQRMPHPTLVGGTNPQVQAAGMVNIRGGKIYSMNNASGHFKPSSDCLIIAKEKFSELPNTIFSKNFQGYIIFE